MHIPASTYRIQFYFSFGFKEAQKIISYLNDLGVSDLYASPVFKARKGSFHGYDLLDPDQVNPELGGERGWRELDREMKRHGMGWIQDVVPNHMAYHFDNEWLRDLLEKGFQSSFFNFFDIQWDHPFEKLKGKVLAPFLGEHYGKSLEEGKIRLEYREGQLVFRYHELRFPLNPLSYKEFLTQGAREGSAKNMGPGWEEYRIILSRLDDEKSEKKKDRSYFQETKQRLWGLYQKNEGVRNFIHRNLKKANQEKGSPERFDFLDRLLSQQFFRMSFWKVANEEINYRRFFNINELICLRNQEKEVFDRIHSFLFKGIQEKRISGLRIDHVDGLYDPFLYLKWLRERGGEVYTIVEKILDLGEELPSSWPVQGTTGYDWLNYMNGLFCKTQNQKKFSRIYSRFTGLHESFESLFAQKKRLIIGKNMAGDIDNLAFQLEKVSEAHRYGKDLTVYGLKRALVEVMAWFPVYRTYVSQPPLSSRDLGPIQEALGKARSTLPELGEELNLIEKFLLLEWEEGTSETKRKEWRDWVMKFQQYTGPVMAKGFEDTLLYIYNRLLSLNEVGGDPSRFGVSDKEFHKINQKKAQLWPHSLNATSTHDTKRGEDLRARINVLSEIPEEWKKNLNSWSRICRKMKTMLHGRKVPDKNDEYFLFQTLVGAWPFHRKTSSLFKKRIQDYIIKAVREAKVHTAWIRPDEDYERAFLRFVDRILDPSSGRSFLKEFEPFQRKVAHYGLFNSLSQIILKIASPGVPDFYQGTELWDFNLVDPDNRRPVDYEKRREYLGNIQQKNQDPLSLIQELLQNKEDGRVKMYLIHIALQARRKQIELFQKGDYIPLRMKGAFRRNVIAFARKKGNLCSVTVAPRFFTSLMEEGECPLGEKIWADTCILFPFSISGQWADSLTGQVMEGKKNLLVGEILQHFPVSFLFNKEEK